MSDTPDNEIQETALMPIDGMVVIEVSEDKTAAYLLITEPKDGGEPVTKEDIDEQLSINEIKYGLDEMAIDDLLFYNKFGKKIRIASGYLPIEGEHGTVEYLYETTDELAPKKNNFDEVDYKDLGLIKNIFIGQIIANIKKSVPGQDGMNVHGAVIPQPPLLEAKYQIGTGTCLSEDESQILASIDGNLRWQKDRFMVDEVLIIKENVDAGTGNIDFIGNIIIKGEVRDNFIVKSKKNITVNCGVTHATLIADGDITIKMGSINSDIISKGNVKIGFCEGSKIECDGDLSSPAFVSSNIFCGGVMSANTGKGVVTGGKYTAILGMDINILGSESFIKTEVTLGNAAVLNEEKLELMQSIVNLEGHIKKLLQIAELLQEHKKKFGNLSADREAMLTTSIRSRFTYQREIKQLNHRIAEINSELESKQDMALIIRKEIWPNVKVKIGSSVMRIETNTPRCKIGFTPDGELGIIQL